MQFNRSISLALSGGGTRAMAYHLGVLKWLAERGLFENVTRISTVSGGSLLMGLIYRSANFRWPSSEHFLSNSLPTVSEQLCSKSLQLGSLRQLIWPQNWRFLLSRANLVALELEKNWGIDVPMSTVPDMPEWSINGTTAENGKRFRFKGSIVGDWQIGYATAPNFPLSRALAVSAAFPIGIGPLAIDPTKFEWRKRGWNEQEDTAIVIKLPYEKLHLYDGGLYDNLGTESFFDVGRQVSKHPGDYIIVSDAGAPLTYGMTWGPLSLGRVKRMMDLMSEQARSLRVRSFLTYIQRDYKAGALLPIGLKINGDDCSESKFARTFPTSLERFNEFEFTRLLQYGYAVTNQVNKLQGVCAP